MFFQVIFGSSLRAMVKKEITSYRKRKEAFWETAFRCVNATHRVTRFSSVFSLLTQFSGNLQLDTSERNEAYGDKGSILKWKLERSFLRDCFLMCDFITHICTFPFYEQLANTVVVDSAKWYLGAHWGLRWKRKNPQLRTRGTLSGGLLSAVWFHHTEFHLSLLGTGC